MDEMMKALEDIDKKIGEMENEELLDFYSALRDESKKLYSAKLMGIMAAEVRSELLKRMEYEDR